MVDKIWFLFVRPFVCLFIFTLVLPNLDYKFILNNNKKSSLSITFPNYRGYYCWKKERKKEVTILQKLALAEALNRPYYLLFIYLDIGDVQFEIFLRNVDSCLETLLIGLSLYTFMNIVHAFKSFNYIQNL